MSKPREVIPTKVEAPPLSLKRLVGRIRCLWSGHEWSCWYPDYYCTTCCQTYEYEEVVKQSASERLRDKWRNAKSWWRCSDCGWRFGRHDKNHDHIPF